MQTRYLKNDRNFWIYLILSILTLGIYPIFFWYSMTEEINVLCQKDEKPSRNYIAVWCLSILTRGLYRCFWISLQSERMAAAGKQMNLELSEHGTFLLFWMLLGYFTAGIGILVAEYFMIRNLNLLADSHNLSI